MLLPKANASDSRRQAITALPHNELICFDARG